MVKSSVKQCLNCFSNFPTVRLWNSSIREAVNRGDPKKALVLLCQMKQNGCKPDNFTFLFAAKACSKLSCSGYSKIIHAHVETSRFRSDVFVLTAVADMYVKCSELGHASKVFERIPVRDSAAWNSMILGFSQSGLVDRVLCLFGRMRLEGVRPDSIAIMGLTRAASQISDVGLLKAIHAIGVRSGLECDVSVANTWISAYAKCNDLNSAKLVFEEIDSGVSTLVSWNSMIEAYSKFEKTHDVVDSYKRLLREMFQPDSCTIVSLLSCFLQPRARLQGVLVHCHAVRLGCDSDIAVVNTLVSMYSKCGDIMSARLLFDRMHCKTPVSWNVMISGYAEKQDLDEARRLLHAMELADEKPDLFTLVAMISGCGKAGAIEFGKWLNNYAVSIGLQGNIIVCNSLIGMYTKCGSVNDARELFYAMPERTLVSWTTMISGCALNSEFKEALYLFEMMIESGLRPNHVTFLAVLQACAHAGLVEKGIEFFKLMTNIYNIIPGLDHYSCLVDLFGRKGRVQEAFEIVQTMPMKPDIGIWSSLLSSCKIHRNVEIAEFVYRSLIELDPTVAVPYIEMANTYASSGKWDGVSSIRKLMKCNNAKKSRGQSIVMVDGKSHVFGVEDYFCCPEGFTISELLNCLMLQLKEEKYRTVESEVNLGCELAWEPK